MGKCCGTVLFVRIATWNVNSVRARQGRVVDWLLRTDTDVLLVQETKCKDEQFPFEPFHQAGYEVAHCGLNQWNGVAIISRCGISDVRKSFPGQPVYEDATVVEPRAIGAVCGGVEVWSLYVPNGRELGHPHLAYKLRWLEEFARWAGESLASDEQRKLLVGGDFNVAPLDMDVWDPEFFADKTHTSEPERAALALLESAGLVELTRSFTPGPGVYTFWDYTQLRFPKKQGMRIDYVYGSAAVQQLVSGASIDRDERKGKGASDHAPVVVELSL